MPLSIVCPKCQNKLLNVKGKSGYTRCYRCKTRIRYNIATGEILNAPIQFIICPNCDQQTKTYSVIGKAKCQHCHKHFVFDNAKYNAYQIQWVSTHKKNIHLSQKKHYYSHLDKQRQAAKIYNGIRNGTSAISLTGICKLCGATGRPTYRHHIIPKEYGNNTAENLIELCDRCHRKTHEFMEKLLWKINTPKQIMPYLQKFLNLK